MHFADTDNCFYKRETARLGEKLGVRLRHKCRGGRVVNEQDMRRAVTWGAEVVYVWWVRVQPKALEHARAASVSVVEFTKTEPGTRRGGKAGLRESPLMRFYSDLEQRARAKAGRASNKTHSGKRACANAGRASSKKRSR
eukprot:gnl/TRDRNA2_/TRDRNA2_166271_c1_seq1.p2 gnl/TRDRNA2_/TRDRNA2_166271_c1~~gnl/TRDRNA2_/TRDRNA2_166271_c1_seq1.p2  ORF type:complete len:140 (-),score=23.94 gnl/TRDRNA2_/TRDRNA2_166271_c1_seq1:173-592(-)